MTVHTMFGHEHARGTGVRVDLTAGGAEPERLYETNEWDGPPIRTFDGGKALSTKDKITVDCEWQNDSPDRVRYPHEMCFAIGYYWPSNGDLICGTGGQTDDCLCQIAGDVDAGPGGSAIEISVSRAEKEDAVPPVDQGAPLYCALWLAEDWAGFGPKDNAPPHYFREAIDVPLKTTSDAAVITFDDVTPGDYAVFCMMDNIGGGFYPGTGDLVSISTPTITAKAGSKATAKAVLDFVFP